jgi:glycosyltransferase involved in cell wall biosynthesis
MPYKIAVVVQGRFYAFDLARELLARGHDVTVFTNYPGRVTERFGVPRARVRSFLTHGLSTRLMGRLLPGRLHGLTERLGNHFFGRWAARVVPTENWDVVIAFSGIAEDLFVALSRRDTLKALQRASCHIRSQRRLLEEEEERTGCWVAKPPDWSIAREEREYELADAIHLVAGFAERSFLEQGVSADKLYRLSLGVDTSRFQAAEAVIEARCQRLLNGEPIRVLNVGTFSLQKGAKDFVEVIRRLNTQHFSFRFVGPVAADARHLLSQVDRAATFVAKQPQDELPREYATGDVFVLPTIQDGFPVVLCQALASGLPLLTTTNCSGSDFIREGETGWVVPIRSPESIVQRLLWCHEHRQELVEMVRRVHDAAPALDWSETARQAEHTFEIGLSRKRSMCGGGSGVSSWPAPTKKRSAV